jgi:hypothetical protein
MSFSFAKKASLKAFATYSSVLAGMKVAYSKKFYNPF